MSNRLAVAWTRRSVERDVKRWEEYPKMIKIYNDLAAEGVDVQMVFGVTFLTGGRITEVLNLKRDNFLFYPNHNPPHVKVIDMMLLKHYQKEGEKLLAVEELPKNVTRRLFHWDPEYVLKKPNGEEHKGAWLRKTYVTVKEETTRNDFAFRIDEPFVENLKQWLNTYTTQQYIFPSRVKPSKHLSRSFIYRHFIKHDIYPHWVRSQRASNLRTYHGLSMEDLMDWFTWLDFKTAMRYARMGTEEILGKFKPVSW